MGNNAAGPMRFRKNQGPVVKNKDGTFSVNLNDNERQALANFVTQLEELLLAGPDDVRVRRLYPTAYHQDADKDAEYQGFMRDELTQSRATSIATVRDVLTSTEPIDEHKLHAFMTVINGLRLVLGTLLDVTDDGTDPEDSFDEQDPEFAQWQLYGYLGWLLEWTVSALAGD